MKKTVTLLFVIAIVLAAANGAYAQDEGQLSDTPYFSGMPNYRVVDVKDREFDDYRFFNGKNCTTVEGKKLFRAYSLKENAKQASDLQITRNYASAVRGMGGAVVFEGQCEGVDCAENCGYRMIVGKVLKGGSELWIEVVPFNDGYDYYLTVMVKEAMKQDVTASEIFEALKKEGHIALYINFDTGKSIIKPESKQIVEQIASMMKNNPGLKLSVEGHTDNVGDPGKNRTLSEDRAKAVVDALVREGIDPKSLSSAGFGQDKPIADNETEEGRAKNRRVELVKK